MTFHCGQPCETVAATHERNKTVLRSFLRICKRIPSSELLFRQSRTSFLRTEAGRSHFRRRVPYGKLHCPFERRLPSIGRCKDCVVFLSDHFSPDRFRQPFIALPDCPAEGPSRDCATVTGEHRWPCICELGEQEDEPHLGTFLFDGRCRARSRPD